MSLSRALPRDRMCNRACISREFRLVATHRPGRGAGCADEFAPAITFSRYLEARCRP
jgi:hypothetical protein